MPRLDFRVADGEDSTMKEIIQSLLGILGFGHPKSKCAPFGFVLLSTEAARIRAEARH